MRKFFNGLVLGVILGGAAVWFFMRPNPESSPAESRFRNEASNAIASAGTAVYHLTEAAKAKLESLDLRPEQISEELARTGKIVRRRARDLGGEVADAATNPPSPRVSKPSSPWTPSFRPGASPSPRRNST